MVITIVGSTFESSTFESSTQALGMITNKGERKDHHRKTRESIHDCLGAEYKANQAVFVERTKFGLPVKICWLRNEKNEVRVLMCSYFS